VPFTAVMTREDGGTFEVSFATMGEAEAFIRRNTPAPAARSRPTITIPTRLLGSSLLRIATANSKGVKSAS